MVKHAFATTNSDLTDANILDEDEEKLLLSGDLDFSW